MGVFTRDTTTDQKRLVRGEHILLARTLLRARDWTHNKKWQILFLAGRAPRAEMEIYRNLMPSARVIAADKDQASVESAIESGADEVFHGDLADFDRFDEFTGGCRYDLVSLDLCSNDLRQIKRITQNVCRRAQPSSPVILTFSYGRDVAEVAHLKLADAPTAWRDKARAEDIPLSVLGRIAIVLPRRFIARETGRGMKTSVRSIIVYRGNEMPMCSVLFSHGTALGSSSIDLHEVSFARIGSGDFELAVTCPDPSTLYDVPGERIRQLRRKHAAIKAAYTRSLKKPVV